MELFSSVFDRNKSSDVLAETVLRCTHPHHVHGKTGSDLPDKQQQVRHALKEDRIASAMARDVLPLEVRQERVRQALRELYEEEVERPGGGDQLFAE